MNIHQIRNATLVITYNGKRFLIDPWLMPKEFMAGFSGAIHADVRQPRVELPLPIEAVVSVDAVILTHIHPDHWDDFAARALDKHIPFFVQNEVEAQSIRSLGFHNVRVISETGTHFDGIILFKTGGQHGRREIVKAVCEQIGLTYDAMGVVFTADNEKTLYLAGDTIWCEEVRAAVDAHKPDMIIANACGAMLLNGEKLIMDTADIQALAAYTPKTTIIASHMDTVSHLSVTRDDIRRLNLRNVLVPEDNEILAY
ncbi:MAG: MBL fold metallo-hydrolase [Desulfovibrionaceae bacterium]|nr:MBL fold metallo-hydrolase [Desulfovibrionaceae bacterium]